MRNSRNIFALSLVTIVIVASLVSWSRFSSGGIKSTIYEIIERAEASNMGYSSTAALLGLTNEGSVTSFIKQNPLEFLNLVLDLPYIGMVKSLTGLGNKSSTISDNLPVISLDIPLASLKILLRDRNRAIELGYLNHRTWVDSRVSFNGRFFNAKVRLKGDLDDHWRSLTRLSLDVKIKRGSVNGLRRFSIHSPRSRSYPYAPIFSKIIQNQGNIYTPQSQAKIRVNGRSWGIMDVEERISVDFIERQKLKSSVVFSFGADSYILGNSPRYLNNSKYFNGNPNFSIDLELTSSKDPSNIDRIQYGYIIQRHILEKLPFPVDYERMANELAISLIWGNSHHSNVLNKKYYMNPYSLLLEPVSGDVDPPLRLSSVDGMKNLFDEFHCPCSERLKYDLLVRALEILTSENEIISLSSIQANRLALIFPNDKKYDTSIFNDNLDWIRNKRKPILENFKYLKEIKSNQTPLKHSSDLIDNASFNDNVEIESTDLPLVDLYHFDSGKVAIVNLTSSDLHINKIIDLSSGEFKNTSILLSGSSEDNVSSVVVSTNIKGIKDNRIRVLVDDDDSNFVVDSGFSLIDTKNDNDKIKVLQSSLQNRSIVNKADITNIHRFSGKVFIDELEVYYGQLIIEPGTQIHFQDNGALVVVGELEAKGSPKDPILFSGTELGGSIYIIGSLDQTNNSVISNAHFLNLGAFEKSLFRLTGALTLYKSNALIKESIFDNFSSEDVINVVSGNIIFNNNVVKNSVSDAVDFDFSTGSVDNFFVSNIGGDGLDFSGSTFDLSEISCDKVKDKCISAGESSIININNLLASETGVGIASKDGSKVVVKDVNFSEITLKPFMAYNKKPIFGGARLDITDEFEKNYDAISQYGSSIYYNNQKVEPVDINITELYSDSIMKK